MTTAAKFERCWYLQKSTRKTPIVRIVCCAVCYKSFDVVGEFESTNEISQVVECPYCERPNDMVWPIDTPFPARQGLEPMLIKPNSERTDVL